MDTRSPGNLLAHLLAFGYLLRAMGIPVSPGQVLDLLGALEHVPVTCREDFHATLRCILVLRHEHLPFFDAAFAFYWRSIGTAPDEAGLEAALPQVKTLRRQLRLPRRLLDEPDADLREEEREETAPRPASSRDEILRKKDFAQCTWEEVERCKELIRRMPWRVDERSTRRRRPARNGRSFDLRRTLRRAQRYGGVPVELARREVRLKPRPVVVLCDISGSMERYARILLQFVYAISAGLHDVEAFVFGTRLTRITRQLRHRDIDDAIDAVSKLVVDWSGGTRIGDAVKAFNYCWGRRVLGRGPVVLLISDGWDRGEPLLLGREMDRLRRSCHRLIWLNPLLGHPGYVPLTVGMQAALPHVDDFLPVHNLASLEQLGIQLASLSVDARRSRFSVK